MKIRFHVIAVLMALFVFSLLTFSGVSLAQGEVSADSMERVIVHFKGNKYGITSSEVKQSVAASIDGDIAHSYTNINAIAMEIPKSELNKLRSNPNVASVEIDQIYKEAGQVQDWGVPTVGAPDAWKSGFTGKGVKIAVVGTGIASHSDLSISGGKSFVRYEKSYQDYNGHGTMVAGVIGAKNNSFGIVGVAPNAKLYAVKVLDKVGYGYVSDIVAGIDWAISNKMDIIHLNLVGNYNYYIEYICYQAYMKGILIVAPSGNNYGRSVSFPASLNTVISVSAIDYYYNWANFSAAGAVDVVAPGVSVWGTYLNNKFLCWNSTTMAAAHVTGTLALLKNAYPNWSASSIRNKLLTSTIDLGYYGWDSYYGYGLVQAPVKAQSVSIYNEDYLAVSSGAIDLGLSNPTIYLTANVYPARASQSIKWTSSNSKVAKVDAYGDVTGVGVGTATITASATDGSGKSKSCKVTVARLAEDISISGPHEIASGKSILLKATVLPSITTKKSVTWSSSNSTVAKVSSSGTVTALKTTSEKQVIIYAKTTDGSGVVESYQLTVKPAAQQVTILKDGLKVPSTIYAARNEKISLKSTISPSIAHQNVKWSSSSTKYATVDANGVVTCVKTGSVYITATAVDGTGKKATCKIIVR